MKKPLHKNSLCKAVAILVYAVTVPVFCAGLVGTIGLLSNDYYTQSQENMQKQNIESRLNSDLWNLDADFTDLKNHGYFDENISEQRKTAIYQEFMGAYDPEQTNFFFCIYDMDDNLLLQSGSGAYQASKTFTHNDRIWHESEQIMSESEYEEFCNQHQHDEVKWQIKEIQVAQGAPAPTLPGDVPDSSQPSESITETVQESMNFTESPEFTESTDFIEATEFTESQENPEDLENPENSENSVNPETTYIPEHTETMALMESPFDFAIHANAENRIAIDEARSEPVQAYDYSLDYSLDEQIQICNALGVYYYQRNATIWVEVKTDPDSDISYSEIRFEDFFRNILNQNPSLEIFRQNGVHCIMDYHVDPCAVRSLAEYAGYYPEEFVYQEEFDDYNYDNYDTYYDVRISEPEDISTHYIIGYVKAELTAQDSYFYAQKYTSMAYFYRYTIPVVTILAFLLCVTCFLFAVSSAGYHTNQDEPSGTIFEKIPYDLFTVGLVFAGIFTILMVDEFSSWEQVILIAVGIMILSFILLWFCMSTATRIRTKTIIKNNILYKIFALLRKLFGNIRNHTRKSVRLLDYLPFVWKSGLFAGGAVLLDIFATVLIADREEFGVFLKILMWMATIAGTILIVYQLHLLETGGQNLADGKLDEKINTKRLTGVFRKHAENLNSISDGMNRAVSDRLKSELFKTELIANVSHDIRTPLTSIINYTDLLSKLNLPDEKATEYISVLMKQSARLRKLTEDVLEASKATAGTTRTEKEIMDMKVLLEQLTGEYAERFEQQHLQLIPHITEHSLMILGDGRLLWRALDNLFGNICKYAMPHTRVYLSADSENHWIQITLRNISSSELNISSDALMERFIRGDRSRNTEGSGLGLSIAQSFINLHNGELTLHIDGDLFKVSIDLPEYDNSGNSGNPEIHTGI